MSEALTDAQISEALATCADEPVHIPGTVQPFGCLIAADVAQAKIAYVSENAEDFLGRTPEDLLGASAPEVLGRDIWHGVLNAAARSGISQTAVELDDYDLNGRRCALRVHRSGDHHVIEIEPAIEIDMGTSNALRTLSYLTAQIQGCDSEQRLFDLTCELLQHLTSYDRVLIYRFDRDFNGEVLSEVKRGPQDSFLGLRFPHWDIPAQAREIMKKVPLRFIYDNTQIPVPILAPPGAAPLDITLANSRGVSPVHMEYLRNMGTSATMTLSVNLEDKLWGIISFHHRRPRVPAPGLRAVLVGFLDVFNGKLLALRQRAALDQIQALDVGTVSDPDKPFSIEEFLPNSASRILEVMGAQGLAAVSDDKTISRGDIPDPKVIEALSRTALTTGQIVASNSLARDYPELADKLGKVAGALVVSVFPDRAVCLFRNEISVEVAWAGSPGKTVERVGDRLRLSPRGSFSTYLQQVDGQSEPWSENDIYLIGHLRTLLHAAERQTMMETLTRQQALMIGELNHRVRNILALVRSVSRQARRRYGSLNSYANAIENRIRALAAAHDISGGSSTEPVPVRDLIAQEFEPYGTVASSQAQIFGPDRYMRAEMAPIFSLVVHELTTNAAKYGALSIPEGQVTITQSDEPGGHYSLEWRETGGPRVVPPNEHGFGMALIQQAVPHELGGEAETNFRPEGFHARFTLPARHFTDEGPKVLRMKSASKEPDMPVRLPPVLCNGVVMVLEDTFITAKEMADQLTDLGCADVRFCSSIEAAVELIETEPLSFAVLDVDLSAFGAKSTSEEVAIALYNRKVPFLFATGFGQDTQLPEVLDPVPKLTKPISNAELVQAATALAGS